MNYIAHILLLAISLAPCAQADNLGRLFFTPEQRAQLEYNRTHPATAKENDAPSMLRVNGIVQKHGGACTAWINGVAQDASKGERHTSDALTIAVPGKLQPVQIKVGQELLLDGSATQSPVIPTK